MKASGYIIHNSDWSGTARVSVMSEGYEFEVPGQLLLKLGYKAARMDIQKKLIRFAEDLDEDL